VNRYRMTCATALAALALSCSVAATALAAGDATGEMTKRGSQWISMRAGYAKGGGEVSPGGRVGFGFGYRRFVLDSWSVGGFVDYDLLGRFGSAADIEVPITLEVVRHSHWGAAVFPYLGFGAGAFYHKQYRTGADGSAFGPGRYLTFGAYTPVRAQGLLGLDVRMAMVDKPDSNPVFLGPSGDRLKVDDLLKLLQQEDYQNTLVLFGDTESKTRILWGAKIAYSITY
jgi:hypothetical protein